MTGPDARAETAPPAPPEADEADVLVRVQRALLGEGVRTVLQPVVDVRSGALVGAEVLARFDETPYVPDAWFAEAGRMGLRADLEVAMARLALSELAALPPRTFLSLNLSPAVLAGAVLGELLTDVDVARVVLEVTEHAPVPDYAVLDEALASWRAAGLRIAVDDTGAGYSSFRHILHLRPDIIKIDISLVRDIDVDPVRQALARSMLGLARASGALVLAEGVETQGELDTLARLGVTLVQGNLLGRPSEPPLPQQAPRPSAHVLPEEDAPEIAAVVARAVTEATDVESLVRPLLDVALRVTGLDTAFLALVDKAADRFEFAYVRGTGGLDVLEGTVIPWSDTLCVRAEARGLDWTMDVPRELPGSRVSAELGVQTFVTIPVHDRDGGLLGTLCSMSRRPVYLAEETLAQLRLFAHLICARYQQLGAPSWRGRGTGPSA